MSIEQPLTIGTDGGQLVGILHRPDATDATRGVVILVGGPQYRVGSHRQFVLLARELCRQGAPVLRFDFAGMGDSDGEHRGFDKANADIRAAIDCLQELQPSVREVCLWGLCDAASAALIYAPDDPRVTALVLLNPWVRTSEGQAQTYLDRYYGRRLRSRTFWHKLATNPSMVLRAGSEYLANLRIARRGAAAARAERDDPAAPYLVRMLVGAQRFPGRMLILLSGNDLVATEFELRLAQSRHWRQAFAPPRAATLKLPEATHTFARRAWRDWVALQTARFVREQPGDG
jgi:exosortase A-associated hydrolase 1